MSVEAKVGVCSIENFKHIQDERVRAFFRIID